jgi:outer membrane protein TolC
MTLLSRLAMLCLLLSTYCRAEQPVASLTLKHAVELALTHSSTAASAAANEQRAYESYLEARDQYIPQLTVGSGLGKTYGYPLSLEGSAPSIVNFTSQSALINPALREFIRAAKIEHQASTLQAKDQRNQVIQDTVVAYVELDRWQTMRSHLDEQHASALHAEQVETQRVQAGVDGALASTQARLATARVDLRIAQADGSIELLRIKLSHLTGIPAADISADTASIPTLPELPTEDLSAKAVASNPAVEAADSHFMAQLERAKGEHRALWPTIDFAAQYALLASFNNYEDYFRAGSFQQHNATVGIAMRFNFLNESQRAHARAADAEAIVARNDARAARDRVSEETLRLQNSVRQLAAAQKVADLEFQLSESNLHSAQIRANSGNGTLHDTEDARTQSSERFNALQDANFDLESARIALLRATGELPGWVGVAN